jgi:hypothetical protein
LFDDFLPALNWWITLSDLPFAGRDLPALSHYREALNELEADVLMAYGPAHQEARIFWDAETQTARFDLLKKYRLYTMYVMTLILEVWPGLILERAFKESSRWI